MENKHTDILYYTEVCWLSRENAPSRFVVLKDGIIAFFGKGKQIQELEDEQWSRDLAYLTNISSHLNALNTTL